MNAVLERKEDMKFVLNGRTFDTATSSTVAISRGVDVRYDPNLGADYELRWEAVLYRTPKGAFFVHTHTTKKFARAGRPVTEDMIAEKTPENATEWIEQNGAAVMDATGLSLPPDA